MPDREVFGYWSIDGRAPVEGRLLIDASGQIDLQVRTHLDVAPRLVGRLSDGSPATLFGAGLLRRDPDRHFVEEYRIGAAILGLDLADNGDPCLVSASRRISGLEQLIGTSGLSLEAPDADAEQERSAKVVWEGSEPIEASLPMGTLRLVDFTRFERDSDFRYSLQHIAEARFEAREPLGLDPLEEVFDILAGLIAFATEARVEPGALWVTRVGSGDGEHRLRGEVLAGHRPYYGRDPGEADPWLTLRGLSNPAEVLEGFHRFTREQSSAYLILFELMVFLHALNPIDKLLYLARFLEVYHRTRFPGQRDPEDVHEEREDLVRGAVGKEHKKWVSQILHHSNEITFKERIVRLLEGPAAVAAPVIGAEPIDFARVVGDCRNYWTHYSPDLEAKALRDTALDNLDDRLLLLVRACVLDDIGVDSAEAEIALRSDWRWARYESLVLADQG